MLQSEAEDINAKYKLERAALEKKYELLRSPVLEKRRDIITGDMDVELEGESGMLIYTFVFPFQPYFIVHNVFSTFL